jgi:hypothetical protein
VSRVFGAMTPRRVLQSLGLALTTLLLWACDEDTTRLAPVSECQSHDECVRADDRFDQCAWVCEGHITYCQVSCEVDADCEGRGLPPDMRFCDVPRPGEGFCNRYNFDYADDACRQEVPEIPDEQP